MLRGVRWYVAAPRRTRHVAERMEERGVEGDHAPLHRWVSKDSPLREEALHCRTRPVWGRGRREGTALRGKGPWTSRDRAVDTGGQTMALRLTEPRDQEAARRCWKHAIRRHGGPETRTLDGRDAQEAASKHAHQAYGTAITLRQGQDCNNLVEQDHRAVQRVTRPMLGCKSCAAAQRTLVGMARMPMLKKNQRRVKTGEEGRTAAEPFDALAAEIPTETGATAPS